MTDTMRWRYGDTKPVQVAVDAATVIEIGDLVFLDTDDAKPASSTTFSTLAAAQEAFHDAFIGVAMQHSGAGETKEIRVATAGAFELDCTSATFEIGGRVGVAQNGGGTALENQKVVAVAAGSPQLSIGRVARRVPSAATRVAVEIMSTVMHDGPQAVA